jgi:hypothetical protein
MLANTLTLDDEDAVQAELAGLVAEQVRYSPCAWYQPLTRSASFLLYRSRYRSLVSILGCPKRRYMLPYPKVVRAVRYCGPQETDTSSEKQPEDRVRVPEAA